MATVRLRPGRAPVTREIPWVGEVPSDLEALDAVPGRPHHYIAVASGGTAHHIIVAHGRATLQGDPVVLPGRRGGDNYESFALHRHAPGEIFADGPFSSAVYVAGRLSVNRADRAVLTLRRTPDLKPLRHCTKQHDRKIEAIAFLPDRQALWGTDNENKGGSVKFNRVNRVNRVNP